MALSVLFAVLLSLTSIFFGVTLSFRFFLITLALILLVLLFLVVKGKLNFIIVITLCAILYSVVSTIFISGVSKYERLNFNDSYDLVGYIVELEPTQNLTNVTERVITVECEVDGERINVKLKVPKESEVYIGNKVEFNANLYKLNVRQGNKIFLYNLNSNVEFTAYDVNSLKISKEIFGFQSKLKYKILSNLKTTMSDNYPIAYAMVTGEIGYINGETLDVFRKTGIAHIFAVSGLHIGFLYGVLRVIFKIFKLKGLVKLIITFPILLFYVWFCGFSSSCIRAFIIITVACLSESLYQKFDTLTAVCIAFIVALLLNPFDFYSLGFRLSFTVYSAIVFLTKPTSEFLSKILFKKVADYLAPYSVAFLASIPLLVDSFGYVSAFSMLFNMLLVPLLGTTYVLIIISILISFITKYYAILILVPNTILYLIKFILGFINVNIFLLEGFIFGVAKYSYYLVGIINAGFLNISKNNLRYLTSLLLFTFILTIIAVNIIV